MKTLPHVNDTVIYESPAGRRYKAVVVWAGQNGFGTPIVTLHLAGSPAPTTVWLTDISPVIRETTGRAR